MKKLIILLFVIGISFQGFSQPDVNQVFGKWKYTANIGPGEQLTGIINFIEKEDKLAGEVITSDGYNIPFNKLELKEENIVYFELTPEYDVIKVSISIEDDKFNGTGSSVDGEFPLTGEKQKE